MLTRPSSCPQVAQLHEAHTTAMENITRQHEIAQREAAQLSQQKQDVEVVSSGLQRELDEKISAAEKTEVAHQKALEALQAECNAATESVRTAQSEAVAARQECKEKVERLSMELADLRSAHESKHASTQSYNQQQLLNLRGQLDALEQEKQLAVSDAEEQRRRSHAALIEFQAEKKVALEHNEAHAKKLADKVFRAEAALAEAQQSAAASAKRESELVAAVESLTAEARSNADTLVKRESELETRIRSLDGQLQEARSRASDLAQRAAEVAAQLESLKQGQAVARAATCPPNPVIQVTASSLSYARASAPAPAVVRTLVPTSLSAPQLMAQQLDHSKVRRRSSSSASKRSVGKPTQALASMPSSPPASQPEIATAQASVAHQNAAAPSVQAEDKAPPAPGAARAEVSRSKPFHTTSLPMGSKGGSTLVTANSQAAPPPNALSGRRPGVSSKKKVQRVSSATRPSDIFDFD
eukprot:scaffold3418_cov124-Isochrysis_galbana.AAC.30